MKRQKWIMDFSPFEFGENTLKCSNLLNESEVYYRLTAPGDLHLRKRNNVNTNAVEAPTRRQKSDNSRRRRGRPRKGLTKCSADDKPADDASDASTRLATADATPLSRTRYGRVTRPPKHMSKFIDIIEPAAEHLAADAFNATTEPDNSFQTEPTVVAAEPPTEPKKIRRNLERFTCGVCKKVIHRRPFVRLIWIDWINNCPHSHSSFQQIYLSKKKMLSHLNAFPGHRPSNGLSNGLSNPSPTNSFLFNELTRSLSTVARNDRCKYLLGELSNFVTHLNVLKESLLPPCMDANVDQRPHYVDKNISQLFGIQEGNYNLNESVLEHYQCQMEQRSSTPFDGIEASLPSVVSMQPSKYDLVPINEVNYDQITDNAMEAVSLDKILSKDSDVVVSSPILDISLDMFQFNGTWKPNPE